MRELACSNGDQHGRVLASFGYGHYLKFGTTIFAVGEERIHAGPLHLLCAGAPPELHTGSSITMSTDRLWSPDVEIDLRRANEWNPPHPGRENLDSSLRTLETICPTLPPPDLDLDWHAVARASLDQDATSLWRLLEGRGPGLTPVGDDVLAGVALLRALDTPQDAQLRTLAQETATTDLSRAFLYWASRGHSIEPIHRLIQQASAGLDDAAQQTAATISNIGASSGQAILFGIGLAARSIQATAPLGPHRFPNMSDTI